MLKLKQEIDSRLIQYSQGSSQELELAALLDKLEAISTTASHKRELAEYRKEYRRLQIENKPEVSSSNYYDSERTRLESALQMGDEILLGAYNSRQELAEQTLLPSSRRLSEIRNRFPLMNNVLSMINSRKHRDVLIIAGVCSVCIILLILYARS
jgi:hypothetical protein